MGPVLVQPWGNVKAMTKYTVFALTKSYRHRRQKLVRINIGIRVGCLSFGNSNKDVGNRVCMDHNLVWFGDVNHRCFLNFQISFVDPYWRDWEQNMLSWGWWGIQMQTHLWKNLPCSDLLLTLPTLLLMKNLCLEFSAHEVIRARSYDTTIRISQCYSRSKTLSHTAPPIFQASEFASSVNSERTGLKQKSCEKLPIKSLHRWHRCTNSIWHCVPTVS